MNVHVVPFSELENPERSAALSHLQPQIRRRTGKRLVGDHVYRCVPIIESGDEKPHAGSVIVEIRPMMLFVSCSTTIPCAMILVLDPTRGVVNFTANS